MPRTKALLPEDVRSICRGHTATMISVLVSIARSKEEPPAARVSAATGILDRGWGKPDQTTQNKSEITVIIRKLMHEPLVIDHDDNQQSLTENTKLQEDDETT